MFSTIIGITTCRKETPASPAPIGLSPPIPAGTDLGSDARRHRFHGIDFSWPNERNLRNKSSIYK